MSFSVWDLGRLHRFVSAGTGREEVLIDLEEDFGGALPALPAHLTRGGLRGVSDGDTRTEQLAAIYDRWGAASPRAERASVPSGAGKRQQGHPEHHRERLGDVLRVQQWDHGDRGGGGDPREAGGLLIRALRNLQIVNGGQTTASIHAASRKKDVDLSRVFVQVKLSVVGPARAVEIVPRISEYANTQNRVSAADFFANHPFHIRTEEFSRRIFAPSPDGTFRESKWFYERARGQYQDARGKLSGSPRTKFDLEYPKSQVVSKTDLAKFLKLVARAPGCGQPWLPEELRRLREGHR